MPRFNQNKIEKQERATNQMQKTNSGFVCYVVSQWKEKVTWCFTPSQPLRFLRARKEKNVKKEKWHDV